MDKSDKLDRVIKTTNEMKTTQSNDDQIDLFKFCSTEFFNNSKQNFFVKYLF